MTSHATPRTRRAIHLLLSVAGVTACVSATARADLKNYISPVNSSWQANLAWSPTGAPTTFDHLVFDRAVASFITFDTASNVSSFHTYRRNTVNVDVPGLHVVSDGMIIGNTTNDATLNLRNGTLAVNATSTLGSVSGGHGILRLEEPDVEFSVNGTSSLFTVGRGGAGDVFVASGSVLRCDGPVIIGDLSTSSAAIHINGVSPNIPSRFSKLETTTPSGNVTIGDAGRGFLNVSNLGRLDIDGNVGMGLQPGSLGRINFAGQSTPSEIAGNLSMASRPGAAAAGEAIISVTAGTLRVLGSTIMGDSNGGDATISINGGIFIAAGGLGMVTNHATLNLLNGALRIGGVFTPNFADLTLNAASPAGSFHMQFSSGSTQMLGTLQCGATSGGVLSALSDTNVVLLGTGGPHRLGQGATGEGSIFVSNAGLIDLRGVLDAGVSGTSLIDVDFGGELRVGTLNMAVNAGSASTLTIDNGGRVGVGTGGVFIGGSAAGAGGSASATLTDDSTLASGGDMVLRVGQTLSVTSSTVTAVDDITVSGAMVSPNSIIEADLFQVVAPGTFTGHGHINARISGNGPYTLTGALFMGDADSTAGVATTSSFAVGSHNLRFRDANIATAGPITLGGGTLGSTHEARSTNLSGNGSVLCDYNPGAGVINATGVGLTFFALLTNPNLTTIGGTRITFAGTGGFTGAGTIAAPVTAESGSLISATGGLTLGSNASTTGAVLNGDIELVGGNLTALDSNGASIGGNVALTSRALVCVNGLSIQSAGVVTGPGTLSTLSAQVQSAGRIRCETRLGANNTAINQPYAQAAGGRLEVRFLDSDTTTRLACGASAALNGTLIVNSDVPLDANRRYTVLTCASRTGTFANVQFPAVPQGGFRVEYFNNRVDVVFCLSDFNGDGSLDPDDLSDYIACYFSTPPCAQADMNGDQSIDPDDLSDYIAAFFTGCP